MGCLFWDFFSFQSSAGMVLGGGELFNLFSQVVLGASENQGEEVGKEVLIKQYKFHKDST